MTLGRVVGSIVSTIKHPAYNATKLLLVQPVGPEGTEIGPTMVCMDNVGAAPESSSSSARKAGPSGRCSDSTTALYGR